MVFAQVDGLPRLFLALGKGDIRRAGGASAQPVRYQERPAPPGPWEDRTTMTMPYLSPVLRWYAANARDLPWRSPDATPWSILVSEIMLQQTPVSRVLPAHRAWIRRWPEPAALAAATPADAVRQWDRLGYPRRAVRLHASAQIITTRHDGRVPASVEDLRSLPGVGSYTAAAVASFAYGARHAVLDTNVRRVLARLVIGDDLPRPAQTAAEVRLAESLLPSDGEVAAQWSVGVMELGALVCAAVRPRCADCPVSSQCAWLRMGRPAASARRAAPRYDGSDRQCRGNLLAVLRSAHGPVPPADLDVAWNDPGQRARALTALIVDGLVTRCADGWLALPGDVQPAKVEPASQPPAVGSPARVT
jgi:A/G-specific adenine glycosylase